MFRQNLFCTAAAAALTLVLATFAAAAEPTAAAINPGVPWPATDALGRVLPPAREVGPPRANRFVGMFYSPWLNVRNRSSHWDGPNDVFVHSGRGSASIEASRFAALGPLGTPHYWGQPLYGYYLGDDPVGAAAASPIAGRRGRRHADLRHHQRRDLRDTYMALCKVFAEVRQPWRTHAANCIHAQHRSRSHGGYAL